MEWNKLSEQQNEGQKKNSLKKPMGTYLQQVEKAQPLDYVKLVTNELK